MSKKIQLLAKIIERDLDLSAQAMALARKKLEKEQAKLSDLEVYLIEYVNRIAEYEKSSATSNRLYGYRVFLAQLEQITQHQQRVVENLNDAYLEKQKIFHYHLNRNKTYQDYMQRQKIQEQKARASKLQQVSDSESVDRFAYHQLYTKSLKEVD